MKVLDALAELRQRYFVCKGSRHVTEIACDIGVTRQTLARFGRGAYITLEVLQAIEHWVEHEEHTRKG